MKKLLPLVSVIMPVHNEEKYIGKAINSILKQSYTEWELIIIDDCSVDNTLKIIIEFKDSRIRVYRNEVNRGIAYSLNRALQLSRGEYIARMDGDDCSVKNRIKIQVDFLKTHKDIALCGGNIRYIKGNRKTIKIKKYCSDYLKVQMGMLFACELAHPTIMLNRRLVDDKDFYYKENVRAEDYELWSRLIMKYRMANINRTLLYYRIHDKSITSSQNRELILSTARVQSLILKTMSKTEDVIILEDQLIMGINNQKELKQIEEELKQIIINNPYMLKYLFYFRNKMDVIYRHSEVKMNNKIDKYNRYWNMYGCFYERRHTIRRILDYIYFVLIKDKLWEHFKLQ